MNPILLSPIQVNELRQDTLIVDLRIPDLMERGFIPGSINIGVNGDWQNKIQELIEKDRSLILLCPDTDYPKWYSEITALGYSAIKGILEGGITAWLDAGFSYDMIISITPEEFWMDYGFLRENEKVVDVRTEEEYKAGSLPDALHIPLSNLWEELHQFNPQNTYYLFCSGGYRSIIATSILKMNGIPLVKNVYGGYTRMKIEEPKQA